MIGPFAGREDTQRLRDELDAVRRELAALRESLDARARDAAAAAVAEGAARAAEAMERRIQLAASEAMAFADQGLQTHEAVLRALGRRVAELGRAPAPAEAPLSAPAGAGDYAMGTPLPEARDCRRIALRDDREESFLSDLANLPILPGGAARLVAAHIVERVAPERLARDLLPHWRSRLAPGGELVVVTLDGPAWGAGLAGLAADLDELRRRLGFAGPRPLRALYDAEALRRALTAAGFAPQEPTRTPPFALRIAAT